MSRCPPACHGTIYDQQVSSRILTPSSPKNTIEIKLFFSELRTEVWEENAAYKFESFFGEIGGLCGLFTGISFITVWEYLCLLGTLLFYFAKKIFEVARKSTKV